MLSGSGTLSGVVCSDLLLINDLCMEQEQCDLLGIACIWVSEFTVTLPARQSLAGRGWATSGCCFHLHICTKSIFSLPQPETGLFGSSASALHPLNRMTKLFPVFLVWCSTAQPRFLSLSHLHCSVLFLITYPRVCIIGPAFYRMRNAPMRCSQALWRHWERWGRSARISGTNSHNLWFGEWCRWREAWQCRGATVLTDLDNCIFVFLKNETYWIKCGVKDNSPYVKWDSDFNSFSYYK